MRKGVEAVDFEECLCGRDILPAGEMEAGVEVDPDEVEVRATGFSEKSPKEPAPFTQMGRVGQQKASNNARSMGAARRQLTFGTMQKGSGRSRRWSSWLLQSLDAKRFQGPSFGPSEPA